MQDTNKPDYESPAYQKMAARWDVLDRLLGGVEKLRTELDLPKFPLEATDRHEMRMKIAEYHPFWADTIDSLVGYVFRDEPKLGDDVSVEIRGQEAAEGKEKVIGWWENLDLMGTHGNEFFKEAFRVALQYGHSVILTDNQPALSPDASPSDEQHAGRRPYCQLFHPSRVLNPIFTVEGGAVICDQITFEEKVTERSGAYGVKEVSQYRTFYRQDGLVYWRLERKVDDKSETFVTINEGATGLRKIPFAVIYGCKTGNLESMPPYWNLAQLNRSHFRQDSDYHMNVAHNQFNVLALIGKNDNDPLPISPQGQLNVPTGGDAKFIAPDPNGPGIALESLKRTEQAMAQAGFAFIADESGQAKTAYEVGADNKRRTSKLADVVKSCKDAAETVLGQMAFYENLGDGGSISIGGDADDLAFDNTILDVLLRAVESGNLTRATWLKVLQRTALTKADETYDPAVEEVELKKQAENMLEPMRRQPPSDPQQ